MNRDAFLLAAAFFFCIFSVQAAKIELEFKGQKQVVEFDPNSKADLDRAIKLWGKADHRTFFIYSETGIFRAYEEPREDSKFKEIGNWYQQLDTSLLTSPYLAHLTWDKGKWYPRDPYGNPGWLKLDDPNIIWPNQLKPVKEWPIRYIAYYGGIEMNAPVDGQKRKYDEYVRWHFDQEGFVLNNRTMKRKTIDGNFIRMFQYRNFVHEEVVFAHDPDRSIDPGEGDGSGFSFNLPRFLERPKFWYDDGKYGTGNFHAWATFNDPIKPVLDQRNGGVCVIACKNRKYWAP